MLVLVLDEFNLKHKTFLQKKLKLVDEKSNKDAVLAFRG